jgi:glycosyltransferase involved in cell wall biosynthesis
MRVAYVKRPPGHGFFAADHDVLALDHEVVELWYPDRPSLGFLRSCWRAARTTDAMYTIFASEHALVAASIFRLWRRRVVIAVGGYDTAADTAHRYGLAAQRRGWVPALVTRMAHRLVAHSEFALAELLARRPEAAAKASVAHLAVDLARWPDPGVDRDADQLVTVATVSRESFYRKGIDRFLAAAAVDPAHRYVLAGRVLPSAAALVADATPNVVLAGSLDLPALNRLLWGSGTYVQLSWHETFGLAMAEAMACGCVPVIADQPALVEVAGRWAVVPASSDESDVDLLRRGVAAELDRGEMRAETGARFAPARRRRALDAALR